jgi:alpha-tubulin suppressor-like RCC1 family protein
MGTARWDGVALGARHGCAHAGDRWACWGSTRDGRLGDGRYARALVPERVGGVDGAVALTAADLQTCALGPGGVSCWGSSALGAVTDGSRALDASVRALEAPAGLVALEMGAGHVAALDGEGEAYHAEPTSPGLTRLGVPEPLGALASGPLGACGLTPAGMPSCWAPTGRDQAPRALTTEVEPAFDALALGPDFQCGIARGTAALWCWGSNLAGQLGVGDRTPRTLPSVAWTEPVRRVSVSLSHGCAVTRAGALLCWGDNARGQLPSRARALLDPTPVPGGPWADVEVGFSHGCALDEGGAAFCWGDNEAGALGDGTTTSRREPTRVASEQTFAELAVGATHTCARTEGGEVWCWGAGDLGQLGDPARAGKHAP